MTAVCTIADVSLSVGTMIARGCRSAAGIPPFARVAHRDDGVFIETIDGALFRVSVEPIDADVFPPRSKSND